MKHIKKLLYRVTESPAVVKAAHTFWQAFLAALLVSGFKLDKTVLLAAVAAGLSAAKSAVISGLRD